MIYLIDGHNLIPHIQGISLDDPHDELHLVYRLRSWAAQDKRRQLLLVFDSGLPGGKDPHLSTSQVQVRFAPKSTTADSLLMRQLQRVKNRQAYTLVSSDQAIISVAKTNKVPYLTSKKFAAQLALDKREKLEEKMPAEPKISEDEVSEWLKLFGPVKPRPKPKPQKQTKKPIRKKSIPQAKASPDEYKQGAAKIADDELEEWLRFFNRDYRK